MNYFILCEQELLPFLQILHECKHYFFLYSLTLTLQYLQRLLKINKQQLNGADNGVFIFYKPVQFLKMSLCVFKNSCTLVELTLQFFL